MVICMYIAIYYLRHEDAIVAILCTGLPITTAGESGLAETLHN